MAVTGCTSYFPFEDMTFDLNKKKVKKVKKEKVGLFLSIKK